jgi:hypothetical protein
MSTSFEKYSEENVCSRAGTDHTAVIFRKNKDHKTETKTAKPKKRLCRMM